MPGDTMKRPSSAASGELPGVTYEEFTLEGYGPGGTAVLMGNYLDNRNRTVAEIKLNQERWQHGGGRGRRLAPIPERCAGRGKGRERSRRTRFTIALEAGAEDVKVSDKAFEVPTSPHDFEAVKKR